MHLEIELENIAWLGNVLALDAASQFLPARHHRLLLKARLCAQAAQPTEVNQHSATIRAAAKRAQQYAVDRHIPRRWRQLPSLLPEPPMPAVHRVSHPR